MFVCLARARRERDGESNRGQLLLDKKNRKGSCQTLPNNFNKSLAHFLCFFFFLLKCKVDSHTTAINVWWRYIKTSTRSEEDYFCNNFFMCINRLCLVSLSHSLTELLSGEFPSVNNSPVPTTCEVIIVHHSDERIIN